MLKYNYNSNNASSSNIFLLNSPLKEKFQKTSALMKLLTEQIGLFNLIDINI